ncbi:MAG: hypothetical protein Q9174_004956 [Haloplaca sp. 1 TL-2023]
MREVLVVPAPLGIADLAINTETVVDEGIETHFNEGESHTSNEETVVMEDQEDVGSDSDGSEVSEDSQMEPFEGYLSKIEKLLSTIGLEGYTAEPIHHGYSFQNCVYAVRHKEPGAESPEYILRVPVDPWLPGGKSPAVANDAALLGFLADKLPVPHVIAYSTTSDNAPEAPFMLQSRLAGRSLDHFYSHMTHQERMTIVDEYVKLLSKLEAVTLPQAGTFTAPPSLPDSMDSFLLAGEPTVTFFNKGLRKDVQDGQILDDRKGHDLKAFLLSHMNTWIDKESKDDSIDEEYKLTVIPQYECLAKIVGKLGKEGAFEKSPAPIVLNHWDLEPRNIMVDKINDSWTITGIIDWDDALALPRPLTRRPPNWIWDLDNEPDFTGYLDNDHHPNQNISEDGMKLKAHFDAEAAAALPGYLEDAYGSGRWLRRVWTIARSGADSSLYLDILKELVEAWEARNVYKNARSEHESSSSQSAGDDAQPSPSEKLVQVGDARLKPDPISAPQEKDDARPTSSEELVDASQARNVSMNENSEPETFSAPKEEEHAQPSSSEELIEAQEARSVPTEFRSQPESISALEKQHDA